MNKVNQSVGRAIRHRGDFAAVVLMDSRYSLPKHRQVFILESSNFYGLVLYSIFTFSDILWFGPALIIKFSDTLFNFRNYQSGLQLPSVIATWRLAQTIRKSQSFSGKNNPWKYYFWYSNLCITCNSIILGKSRRLQHRMHFTRREGRNATSSRIACGATHSAHSIE